MEFVFSVLSVVCYLGLLLGVSNVVGAVLHLVGILFPHITFMKVYECKSAIYASKRCLNLCKFGKDLSQCLELLFKITIFHWNTLTVRNFVFTSHLIIIIQITFLIEHLQ